MSAGQRFHCSRRRERQEIPCLFWHQPASEKPQRTFHHKHARPMAANGLLCFLPLTWNLLAMSERHQNKGNRETRRAQHGCLLPARPHSSHGPTVSHKVCAEIRSKSKHGPRPLGARGLRGREFRNCSSVGHTLSSSVNVRCRLLLPNEIEKTDVVEGRVF